MVKGLAETKIWEEFELIEAMASAAASSGGTVGERVTPPTSAGSAGERTAVKRSARMSSEAVVTSTRQEPIIRKSRGDGCARLFGDSRRRLFGDRCRMF